MDLETLRAYLLAKPGAQEDLPFGPDTLVLKVGGKMFALIGLGETPLQVSLKCDPLHAQMLRDAYPSVVAGYHLNKRHWNTVTVGAEVPEPELLAMIDESYALVRQSLTKAQRRELDAASGGAPA